MKDALTIEEIKKEIEDLVWDIHGRGLGFSQTCATIIEEIKQIISENHSPQVTNNKEVSVVSASLSDTCKNCGKMKSEHFYQKYYCTKDSNCKVFTPIADEEEISSICPQCDMGVSSCLCDEEKTEVCRICNDKETRSKNSNICDECGEHYIEGVENE